MLNLKKKSKGDRFTAQDYNDIIDALTELYGMTRTGGVSGGSTQMRTEINGGLLCNSYGGFSLRLLTKNGDKWQAYFNPGKVYNIGLGDSVEDKTVKVNGADMDSIPYPGLEAKDGELYLIVNVNSEGNIESAELSQEKAEGDTPWKNNDPDKMVDESGVLNFLIGKFETEDDGSLSYLPFHVGGIAIKRANNEFKILQIPDDVLNPPGKDSDSTISVGEGVYKPYHKTEDWKAWFPPLMCGDVLKIEEKSTQSDEWDTSLPSGRYYKIRGDGSNAIITITGNGKDAEGGITTETVQLEFKDGLLKRVNGQKGFNRYDIDGYTFLFIRKEEASTLADAVPFIRGSDL